MRRSKVPLVKSCGDCSEATSNLTEIRARILSMTCVPIKNGFICMGAARLYRLSLGTGDYVYVEFERDAYGGPLFFRDKECDEYIDEPWDDPLILAAWDRFVARGYTGNE